MQAGTRTNTSHNAQRTMMENEMDIQVGQADEGPGDGDKEGEEEDDYEMPSQQVDDETRTRDGNPSIDEVLRNKAELDAQMNARKELESERQSKEFEKKVKEIKESLDLNEQTWILRGRLNSEVHTRYIENTIGNNKDTEPTFFFKKCQELFGLEKKMCEYDDWLGGQTTYTALSPELRDILVDFTKRCSTLREILVSARRIVMEFSCGMGHMGGNADFCIREEQFKPDLDSNTVQVPQVNHPTVNDDLILEATEVFEECVRVIAHLRGGGDEETRVKRWKGKACEVAKMEKFIRDNLTGHTSFSFLEDGEFTDYDVAWKTGGEQIVIKWTRLLRDGQSKESLDVIPKTKQSFKHLLNRLVEESKAW